MSMKPLEIVSEMCAVVNDLYDISQAQQEIIERSDVLESVKAEMRDRMQKVSDKMDIIEYHSRGVIDVDDGEPVSDDIKLYEAIVRTEHKLLIEATGKKSAAEQAKKEFFAMTHIKPKEVFVGDAEKGGENDD